MIEGETLAPGTLVWAHGAGMGVSRDGGLAELLSVPEDVLVSLPEDVDPVLAGALGTAGVAGWLPVAYREPVREGDVVLVLGATGTVGLVAMQGARLLGAGRVVAAGRRPEALERAKRLGADAVVSLESEDLVAAFKEACGGDGPTLVIDPSGASRRSLRRRRRRRARLVNIGQSAGPAAPFLSADVRGKQLNILGYSNFGTPREVMHREYLRLVEHAKVGDIEVEIKTFPFDRAAEAWEAQARGAGAKVVVELG